MSNEQNKKSRENIFNVYKYVWISRNNIVTIFIILFYSRNYICFGIKVPKQGQGRLFINSRLSSPKVSLRTLLIDNYDSYTYNLYQLLSKVNGEFPCVVYNDAFNSDFYQLWEEIGPFDNVVLSPGPGRPDRTSDFGLCGEVLKGIKIPTLGVCLGHQGIGHFSGGKVVSAPEVMHGRYSKVYHNNQGLFQGIPQGFDVVRYHSLVICPYTIPPALSPTAWTFGPDGEGVVMGISHKSMPQWGVQFHPESIGSQYGEKIIRNFNDLTHVWIKEHGPPVLLQEGKEVFRGKHIQSLYVNRCSLEESKILSKSHPEPLSPSQSRKKFQVTSMKLDFERRQVPKMEAIFDTLFAASKTSFWLDSCGDVLPLVHKIRSRLEPGQGSQNTLHGRFSYAGSYDGEFGAGSLGELLEYYQDKKLVFTTNTHSTERKVFGGSIFSFLKNTTSLWDAALDCYSLQNGPTVFSKTALPFDFKGGFVGVLSYEMRHDAQQILTSTSGGDWNPVYGDLVPKDIELVGGSNTKDVPDAFFVFADRFVAYDHEDECIYLVSCAPEDGGRLKDVDKDWFEKISTKIRMLSHQTLADILPNENTTQETRFKELSLQKKKQTLWKPLRSKADYYQNFEDSQTQIMEGETYEICLTNQFVTQNTNAKEPRNIYKSLRRKNPAQYAAFLQHDPSHRLGRTSNEGGIQAGMSAFAVLCSSPECFLKVYKNNVIESKPIKGTARRGLSKGEDIKIISDLINCEKNNAENLMIVDLVRNDFGRVCKIDSVCVPKLMGIETYATVHQLVSSIQGKLDSKCNVIDAIIACFPGGSMTGAPKIRTMELIHQLERDYSRGIYSGSLGFMSVDGVANLNIVIRTAIVTPQNITVGAGGAITALSECDGEYDEMLLKLETVKAPVTEVLSDSIVGTSARVFPYTP